MLSSITPWSTGTLTTLALVTYRQRSARLSESYRGMKMVVLLIIYCYALARWTDSDSTSKRSHRRSRNWPWRCTLASEHMENTKGCLSPSIPVWVFVPVKGEISYEKAFDTSWHNISVQTFWKRAAIRDIRRYPCSPSMHSLCFCPRWSTATK